MATPRWIVAEWFEPQADPSVIAVGHVVKRFVPLERILTSRSRLKEARAAIAEVGATRQEAERVSGHYRTIVVPLRISPDRLHGVMVWSGRIDEPVPTRSPAGAWCFDMYHSIDTRSDDLLALLGIPSDKWDSMRQHSIASVFSSPFTVNHNDQRAAFARLVREVHGTNTQSLWAAVRGSDGDLRALHYSCRQLDEPDSRGKIHHLVRGITYDIGPAAEVPAVPESTTVAHQILEASVADGRFRAIVNSQTLHLLQWQGPPMPGIAWQAYIDQPRPALHPDDIGQARAIAASLQEGEATGRLRVRALDGTWVALDVQAAAMPLDGTTRAALVTVQLAEPTGL